MTRRRSRAQEPAEPTRPAEPLEPAEEGQPAEEAKPAEDPGKPAEEGEPTEEAEPTEARADPHVIDLVVDEIALARAQLDAGLAAIAEGTVRRRIAYLEADGVQGAELDALRLLLAEALWRQGRPVAARAALDLLQAGSAQRRMPLVTLIEAEALAATGEPDRAAGALERVVAAIGVDEAHALRAGVPGRLTWPLPSELSSPPARHGRAPWTPPRGDVEDAEDEVGEDRLAAGRGRLEEARVAYVAGNLERGDGEMSLAVRLDPALAADGISLIEPTLGGQPDPGRLVLYGDLLRAAGRRAEAERAYDRAAERRS